MKSPRPLREEIRRLVRPAREALLGAVAGTVAGAIAGRKRTGEALRRSEEQYRALFETMTHGVVYYDQGGCITTANPAAERILGLPLDEMQGRPLLDPSPGTFREDGSPLPREEHPAMLALRTGSRVENVVMGILVPDGGYRWLCVNAVPQFRSGEEKPYQVHVIFEDISKRKEAERALEEAERKYRGIFENSRGGIFRTTRDGQHLDANPMAAKILGYDSPEELVEMVYDVPRQLYVNPARRAELDDILQSNGSVSGFEAQVRRKDGRAIWLSMNVRAVRDESGCLVYEGTTEDVTRRKQAEEALKESEERYRLVARATSEVIWDADLTEGRLRWDGAIQNLFGYSPDEPKGATWWDDRLHPEDRERVLSGIEEVLQSGGEAWSDEYRFRCADGSYATVVDRGYVVRDEAGEPVRLVGSMLDITDRKRAEEELGRLSRQNELILRSAGEGIYGLDLDGRATFVNPAAAHALGYEAEELTGRPMHDLTHHTRPDGKPYPGRECPIYEAVRDGSVHRVSDEVFWRKDGMSFPVEYCSTPIEEEGRIVGAVVTFRDVTERKRAEERYRNLVERMPAVTYVQEPDDTSRSVYVSPQVEAMLGYTPEECVADPDLWARVIHPDDRGRIMAEYRRTSETGEPFVAEYRQLHKSGRIVWVRDEAALIRDQAGRPLYWQGVQFDITGLKKAEAGLREAEEKYRGIFENATEGIFQATPDGRLTAANPKLAEILGYDSPEGLLGPARDVGRLFRADPGRRVELAGLLAKQGSVSCFETRGRREDGRAIWLSINARSVSDESGRVVTYEGTVRDVTERREAEEALKESEGRFRLLTETTNDLVCLHDPDGRYLYVSPSSRRLLGYDPEELLGVSPYDLFHPDDRERIRSGPHRELLAGEPRVFATYRMRKKSGEYAWLETVTEPIRDEGGNVTRLQTSTRDIGERKKAEEALAEAARAKTEFLADASHELRTPLTVIRGNAEVGLELGGDCVHGDLLKEIVRESGHMSRMVEDLLFLARSDSAEAPPAVPFVPEPVAVGPFLSGLARRAEVLAQQRGAALKCSLLDAADLLLRVDRTRVEQAVLALVDNAAKYGAATHGAVVLSSEVIRTNGSGDHRDELRIEVSDSGPGIPEEDLPRVFERFYRVDKARTRGEKTQGGTGLGLAIAKMIVEAQGGRIGARSRRGEGTRMTVYLPLEETPRLPEKPERSAPGTGASSS